MTIKTHHILALTSVFMSTALTSIAWAEDYDFDESCAPTTLHETQRAAPDALVILDKSGSMAWTGGYDINGNALSKMSIARDAIAELTSAVYKSGPCTSMDRSGCDDVRVGLGWFSGSSGVDVLPGEDTKSSIISTVNSYNPNGGTYVGQAARRIYESHQLRTAERVGIGVLITDGEPSGTQTTEQTVHYLCAARNDYAILTFAVGFGVGADPVTNNLFAAAGGTGQCCYNPNGSCTYQPNELVDPCLLPRRDADQLNISAAAAFSCRGAKQADSGQALKDDLLDLLGTIACTFPLDIPNNYVAFPGADEDQEATRVEFDHAILGNNIRVQPLDAGNPNKFYDYLVNQRGIAPAVAADYIGEGWSFADPFRRTITLTNKLCEEVRSDHVQITETQAACLCENTGSDCNVLCDDNDNDGFDDNTGSSCEYDQSGDFVQAGRCQLGIVDCQVGVEVCVPRFGPQPDICNGIDDDCDGMIDNSSRAKPDANGAAPYKWNGDESQLSSYDFDQGLFCSFEDFACSCGTNPPHEVGYDPIPMSAEPDHEWLQLLRSADAQRDLCSCSVALELDDAQPAQAGQDESTDMSEPQAACQQAPGQAPSLPTSLLLFLGSFAFWRRRLRRN